MSTILILEDEPSSTSALRAILQFKHHSVVEAATGPRAVEICVKHGAIDLVVADVMMPGPSGVAVAVELVRALPGVRFLFVSGTPIIGWSAEDQESLQQIPQDRVDFLEKPFHATDLLEMVENLLKGEHSRAIPAQTGAFWTEVNDSRAAYRSAVAETRQLAERCQDLPTGHSNAIVARRQAALKEADALADYRLALQKAAGRLQRQH